MKLEVSLRFGTIFANFICCGNTPVVKVVLNTQRDSDISRIHSSLLQTASFLIPPFEVTYENLV